MRASQAIQRIQDILGFRVDLADTALRGLQEAQEDLESGLVGILPWFLRTKYTAMLLAGDKTIPLPSDHIQSYDHAVSPLWVPQAGYIQKVDELPEDTSYGGPFFASYFINEDEEIELNFSLEEDTEVTYRYYRRDQTIDNDSVENRWLREASRLMIGLAGGKLVGVRDRIAQSEFQAMQTSGASALMRKDTALRMAGRKLRMGRERYSDYQFRAENDRDLGTY